MYYNCFRAMTCSHHTLMTQVLRLSPTLQGSIWVLFGTLWGVVMVPKIHCRFLYQNCFIYSRTVPKTGPFEAWIVEL